MSAAIVKSQIVDRCERIHMGMMGGPEENFLTLSIRKRKTPSMDYHYYYYCFSNPGIVFGHLRTTYTSSMLPVYASSKFVFGGQRAFGEVLAFSPC